ncbi:MAG: DUF2484 family protein [Pseudomonadota bacterium]
MSLLLACIWAVVANVIAMLPSKRSHWPQAYALIAAGVPILAFVYYQNGVLVTLVVLIAGASMLRWPVRYLAAWLRRMTARSKD